MTSPFLFFIPQKPSGLFVLTQDLPSRETGAGVPDLQTLEGLAGLARGIWLHLLSLSADTQK